MLILKTIAVVFMVAGFGTVFSAKNIVARFRLDEKAKCNFEDEMTEDEVRKYKSYQAMVKVKMYGVLVALPGLILTLIAFR